MDSPSEGQPVSTEALAHHITNAKETLLNAASWVCRELHDFAGHIDGADFIRPI
jgi:hypothetical protein